MPVCMKMGHWERRRDTHSTKSGTVCERVNERDYIPNGNFLFASFEDVLHFAPAMLKRMNMERMNMEKPSILSWLKVDLARS
jgi:hypothetical protein